MASKLPYDRRLANDADFADAYNVEIQLGEANVTTFRRNWLGLGRILSDAGFLVSYGYKSLHYRDERGTFEIGYEDGLLFPTSLCLTNPTRQVSESDKALIIERLLEALKWDGQPAEVFSKNSSK